jgi:CDP-paratose synthetase
VTQRTLVTGATGFLGRALVERLLSEKTEVTVLHPSPAASSASSGALAELRSRGAEVVTFAHNEEISPLIATVDPTVVYHLATKYAKEHRSAEIDGMIAANVTFGTHLLDGLVGRSVTIVTAMSFFQFVDSVSAPYSLYSATKQAFLELARFYREIKLLDVREAVLFDTFGPGDTRDKLIPLLVERVKSGGRLELGPSRQPLNLLYVDDVVAGLIASSAPGNPPRMAVRAQSTIMVGELVAAAERVSGVRLDPVFADERPVNDLVTTSGDWPLPLGWRPQVSLDAGLALTLN